MTKTNTKVLIGIIGLVVIAVGAFFVLQSKNIKTLDEGAYMEVVSRPDLSLEFSYESGPNSLALFEPEVSGEPLKAAYILMSTADFVVVRNGDTDSTPATISLFVFSKPVLEGEEDLSRIEELRRWATANQQLTGIADAVSEPVETVIDGVRALSYSTEAAYSQDIYIASYKKNIYLFVGQHESKDDSLRTYFNDVINSVVFE